ncbi:formate dehydrogenase subunit gamma [Skermanella stibiiresistens SB22]|uniref:Formate dehydrogenase subunit gamma n=1 Tax=Skermanella stibiiresistens SB22 TaxID=1385369 RepID=W9H5Q1_9PROT|nr:formate dehydrogenase subunit gamma [Skermanella stibiiresistens]EWY41374.1 formate dehydrogenase subunit gamma [Skermanella stibiiresistens SB22]
MSNIIGRAPRLVALVFTLLALTFGGALAQTPVPPGPNALTGPNITNEQLLFQQLQGDVHGRVSIPDQRSATLIQPEGQEWREFRNGTLKTVSAASLIGIVAALLIFYATRGKIRIDAGPSRQRVQRFNGVERFAHWITAISFMVLALTGLNLVFGRTLLIPLLGPEAFTTLSGYGKLAHNYLSFPFVLGIALMLLIWVRHNIPDKTDIAWVKAAGGLFSKGRHPAAKKFNAGQKLIFWMVVAGGAVVAASGYVLLFPFYLTDVGGMQLAQLVHAALSVLLIVGIIGHIYIGSVGMEGAFDAMGSGQVDVNWAREHHSLWLEEEMRKGKVAQVKPVGFRAPAE